MTDLFYHAQVELKGKVVNAGNPIRLLPLPEIVFVRLENLNNKVWSRSSLYEKRVPATRDQCILKTATLNKSAI